MCPGCCLHFTQFLSKDLTSAARFVGEMPGLTAGNDKIPLDLLETLYRQEVNS